MAFKCNVELESGLIINNAYLKISNFSGTDADLSFVLNVYVTRENYLEEKPPISSIVYKMEFDKNRNVYSQMYDHLLTFPEYRNAVEA